MPDLRAMQPILQVNNVSKAYAGHVALDGVSLEMPKGSIFGVLRVNEASIAMVRFAIFVVKL